MSMKKIILVIVLLAASLGLQGFDMRPANSPDELNDYIRKSAEQGSESYKLKKQQEEMRVRTEQMRKLQQKRSASRKWNDTMASAIVMVLTFGYIGLLSVAARLSPGRRIIYPLLGFAVYVVLMMISPTGYGPGAAYGKAYSVIYPVMALGIYLLVMILIGVGALFKGTKKNKEGGTSPSEGK